MVSHFASKIQQEQQVTMTNKYLEQELQAPTAKQQQQHQQEEAARRKKN